jgi:hypothetical protein
MQSYVVVFIGFLMFQKNGFVVKKIKSGIKIIEEITLKNGFVYV